MAECVNSEWIQREKKKEWEKRWWRVGERETIACCMMDHWSKRAKTKWHGHIQTKKFIKQKNSSGVKYTCQWQLVHGSEILQQDSAWASWDFNCTPWSLTLKKIKKQQLQNKTKHKIPHTLKRQIQILIIILHTIIWHSFATLFFLICFFLDTFICAQVTDILIICWSTETFSNLYEQLREYIHSLQ